MIVFVDREWSEETIGRLQHVGRYHASRLIVLSYEPPRERLDACATIVAETDPRPGDFAALREAVTVEIGARHLDDLPTIVDPLLVPDLPTLLWSPGEYREIIDELLGVSQAILLDSIDEPVWRKAIERAACLSREVYVVDLAWLRSTPWRERVAMIFDPPGLRSELERSAPSSSPPPRVDGRGAAAGRLAGLTSGVGDRTPLGRGPGAGGGGAQRGG